MAAFVQSHAARRVSEWHGGIRVFAGTKWPQTMWPFGSLLFVLANISIPQIGLFVSHLDPAGECATSLQALLGLYY